MLSEQFLAVEPGQVAQLKVRVKNVGVRVANFRIGVVEDCVASAWTEVSPPQVQLLRGDSAEVAVTFRPPLSNTVKAGAFPFGLRVLPEPNDDQLPIVVEGDLAVGAIHALDIRLVPITTKGRFRGRYRVDVDNRGTETVRIELDPTDGEENRRLQFAMGRPVMVLAPHGSAESFLRVRPDRLAPFGRPKQQPFELRYRRRASQRVKIGQPELAAGDEIEASISGTYLQKPIVSRWMIVAAVLALLVAALIVAWRAINAPAELSRPPDPPELSIIAKDALANFTVRGDSAADEVEVVPVDCSQAGLAIRPPIGDGDTGEPTDGLFEGQVDHEFVDGEPVCLQARVISDGVRSQWTFNESLVGASIAFQAVTPVVEDRGAGLITVTWDEPVTDEIDPAGLVYHVFVNGTDESGPIEGGVRTWPNPEPFDGGPAEIRVKVVGPGGEEAFSGKTIHEVRTADGPRAPRNYWIYFDHFPVEEVPPSRQVTERIILEADHPSLDRDDLRAAAVGSEVAVGLDVEIGGVDLESFPADGDLLIYIDGYESEQAAIDACNAFKVKKAELDDEGVTASAPVKPCTAVGP